MTRIQCSQAGMTLAEILVATVIASLIIIAAFALFRTHHLMAVRQEEATLMHQELLAATTQIAEELRLCGYSPGGVPGFGFMHRPGIGSPDFGRTTDEDGVYCNLDWDGDGAANETGSGSSREHAGFRLDVQDNGAPRNPPDHVLRKYDTGAVSWQPLCTNIGHLRFTYRDRTGAVIHAPGNHTDDIRLVEVSVTAIPSADRTHLGIANRTMTTTVWCRNLPHTDRVHP